MPCDTVDNTSVCTVSVLPSVCPVGHILKVIHQGQYQRGQRTSRSVRPNASTVVAEVVLLRLKLLSR